MPSADVVATIRRVAAEEGFPDVDLLLATAFQEGGFRPDAVGDNGHSVGTFQEHDRGRGAGLSVAQRQDVAAQTRRAIAEFRTIRARSPDVSRGVWAARAQRPADQAGYAASITRMLAGQDRAFASAVGGLGAGPGGGENGLPGPATGPVGPVSVTAADAPDWLQQSWAAGGTFGTGPAAPSAPGAGLDDRAGSGSGPPAIPREPRPAGTTPGFIWPVAGQRVGAVNNPFGGTQARSAGATVALPSRNVGADLTGTYGQDVVAPVGGTVVSVFDAPNETDRNLNSGWGGSTLLRGDDGYTYRLSHARPGSIGVRPGQRVQAGQYLQQIGVSGNTTGPHLDFEKFDRPGHFVDPLATMGQAVATVQAGARGAAAAGAGAWKVATADAPDWLQQAWSAGSTLGKDVQERATTVSGAPGAAASTPRDTVTSALKVVEDAAPDWLKQAWDAGSTFGR